MLKGSLVALVTPFYEDGSVNYDKLEELIEYHIANKTDGLVVLGTTGESSTLSFAEEEKIVSFVVKKAKKRIPIIIGSGSNETEKAVRQSRIYSNLGADYLLVITPYYNKTNEPGLIKHFEMVAEASSCPIILYNVPSRTGMSISEKAISVLAKNPNIIGIKEASGNMSYAMKLVKYLSDDFVMYSGNDDIIVPMMSIGVSGVISVLANIAPAQTHNMCEACLKQDYVTAMKLQNNYLALINDLFLETNPIPVKEAMNYMGYNVGPFRMPLFAMSEAPKAVLFKEIDALKAKGEL